MTDFETHIVNEQYNSGVKLEEYKGTFSLASIWVTKDGETKLRWCYPEKDRKPVEKPMPVKLTLGDKAKACEILIGLLNEIDPAFAMPPVAQSQGDFPGPGSDDGDGIPF